MPKKIEEEVIEETVVEQPKAVEPTPKKFKETELIPCLSVTVGGLHMNGIRSKDLYSWVEMGDVVEVEYRDLVAAIRKRSGFVFKPRFVIQDKDFLAQYPELEDLYGTLYTDEDIRSILTLPAAQMKEAIEKLPIGVKDAIKGLAMTGIDDGSLDSVSVIKALDEIFGTQMLLKLAS